MTLFLVLLTMSCLISCETLTEIQPEVQPYKPVMDIPPAPRYPNNLDWQFDGERFTLGEEDFRKLAEWRIEVEAYIEQVETIYSLLE